MTGYGGVVGIALGSNPGNATLGGTTSEPVAAGVAVFPTLTISRPGTGYTVVATTGALSVTSGPFAVTGASSTKLVLATAPSASGQSGVALAQQPVVQLEDSSGTTVAQSGVVVSVAIASGPTGTISGATATTDASGKASFSGLAIVGPAGAYTLRFSAPGVAAVTSGSIALSAGGGSVSATQSTVSVAPGAITASTGSSASTITVTAKDAGGNPISGATVTLAATGTGNTLTQPMGPTNASGVATGRVSATVAEGKTVSATIAGVAITQTATVAVNAATAAAMAIRAGNTQSAQVGTAVPIAPAVLVTDAFGNPVSSVSVQFSVTSGGGAVAPAVVATSATGVGAVTSWTLGTGAGANTLSASVSGVSGGVSFTATGIAGPVSLTNSQLAVAPSSIVASAGGSVATVTATLRDQYGNPVSGATVTLAAGGTGNALTQPAGASGADGTVTGTLSSTVVGTKVVSAAVGAGTLAQTVSVTVVAGAATQLAFTVQPTNTAAGQVITPAVQVSALDAFGNVAPTFTGAVTVSITPGTGSPLASLSGTLTVSAVAGIATFSDLSINGLNLLTASYRLDAASSVQGATSAAFNVTGL